MRVRLCYPLVGSNRTNLRRICGLKVYIVFDTETTGLPRSWRAPLMDVDNWPRLVQLAWEAFDRKGRKTGGRSYLIRPGGFSIPRAAREIHGISTLMARRKGVPLAEALNAFQESLKEASVVVAHNFQFDSAVVRAELYRLGVRDHSNFLRMTCICTMQASSSYCKLAGSHGYKWPTLPELHERLFGKSPEETHNAAKDTAICSKCFFELLRLGVIRIPGRNGRRAQ